MSEQVPPQIARFPAHKQRLLDQLLDKNSEGQITPAEKKELEELVAKAEGLMVANARRVADFAPPVSLRADSR